MRASTLGNPATFDVFELPFYPLMINILVTDTHVKLASVREHLGLRVPTETPTTLK